MGIISRLNTLRRVVVGSLRYFRPLHRTIPLLAKSIVRRLREGTWRHEPVELQLRENEGGVPFRTVSMAQAAVTLDEAHAHYTPRNPLRPGAVIIDCGGNQGISVRHFKRLQPDSEVHVFEASRQYVDLLRHNLADLSGVHIQHAAVTDRKNEVKLNLYDAPGGESIFSRQHMHSTGQETVPGVALKDYLDRNDIPRVDLLKMDIEGAELLALKGLGSSISKVHTILGEIHPDVVKPADVVGHLESHGFEVRTRPDGNAVMFEAVNRQSQLRKAS